MTMLVDSPLYHASKGEEEGPLLRQCKEFYDATEAVDYLIYLYNTSANSVRDEFQRLVDGKDSQGINEATYPYAMMRIGKDNLHKDPSLSYGVALESGIYGTTITRPDLFKHYLIEQFRLLLKHHGVPLIIGFSQESMPLPFVMERVPPDMDMAQLAFTQNQFVLPSLTRIDDSIANGTYTLKGNRPRPLSLFSAERTDYSLNRLHHYTGTRPEHFQGFILLTNYQRYINEFIDYACEQIITGNEYTSLVIPGYPEMDAEALKDFERDPTKLLPQMPAYHLKRKDGQGITFINIGVGPSNAKNITDHLAILRPHCWLMLGHCAGLRSTQMLGDYVLAHGYVREDKVLDQDLPSWIPVPAIAEVQIALQEAAQHICHLNNEDMRSRLRTGTLLTTDNRNWELRAAEMYERFLQSRAIAVDMESATVAANGFRFRVPYGTLLCISDKPIHGELKLQGMANNFYKKRVTQHLFIGIHAVEILRKRGVDDLHSRKLRGFDEPPFR
jgi:AMP nucleosidase